MSSVLNDPNLLTIPEAARYYTNKGIIVHPLASPKDQKAKSPGKQPLLPKWSELTAVLTEDELKKAFDGKKRNIGAVCGEASDLTVIDIDWYVPAIWNDILNGVNIADFVVQQRKPGKLHYLFKFSNAVNRKIVQDLGFDLLNKASNVVLAPSGHVDGLPYKLNKDIADRPELPPLMATRINNMLNMYNEFLQCLAKCRHPFQRLWKAVFSDKTSSYYHQTDLYRGGTGRELNLALFAELKANGATDNQLLLACMLIFGQSFDMTLSKQQVAAVDPKRTFKNETIQKHPVLSQFYDWRVAKLEADKLYKKEKNTTKDQTIQHVNHQEVAEKIMSDVNLFVTLDDSTFYIYKNGVYTDFGAEVELNRLIRSTSEQMNIEKGIEKPIPVTRFFISEVLDYIRVHKGKSRCDLGGPKNIINLKNGLLNVDTLELSDHSPDIYSIVQYPVEYDPHATCPAIVKFINEVVLPGDTETLLEYTGYSLVPGNSMKVLMMLYGRRDTGKTTYCNLIESLVGVQNITHVSPQSFQDDRFAKVSLYGKTLNTVPDIGDKPLSGTEAIKSLVGNDEITADQKYKKPINFINQSHIFWGANSVPDIKNDDVDFYDKVLMANFPNQFTGSKCDPDLKRKLTTPNELSGFLNLLLAARQQLMTRGKFNASVTGIDSRDRYRRQSNPIASFVEEHVTASVDNISKYELFAHYTNWCGSNGIKPIAMNIFGKRMKQMGFDDDRVKIGDDRPHMWSNVAYIAQKQKTEECESSHGCPGCPGLPRLDLSTWAQSLQATEYENTSSAQVAQVFSKNCVLEENIECNTNIGNSITSFHNYASSRKGLYQKPGQPGHTSLDTDIFDDFRVEKNATWADSENVNTVSKVSNKSLEKPNDIKTLRYDLINYVKTYCPGLIVEDIQGLADAFCKRWPGYRANPGPEYIYQLAEILKKRGWN